MGDITQKLLQVSNGMSPGYPCAQPLPTREDMTEEDVMRDYARHVRLETELENNERVYWHAAMKSGGFDFGEPRLLDVEAEVERKVEAYQALNRALRSQEPLE